MQVSSISVLFTTSSRLSSRLIRAVTGENVSHVALEFGGYVFHSTWRGGVHMTESAEFRSDGNVVVDEIDIGESVRKVDLLRHYLKQRTRYDYLLFLSLGFSLILSRTFGISRSNIPVLQISGSFDCVEFVSKYIIGEELSQMTPGEFRDYLKSREVERSK